MVLRDASASKNNSNNNKHPTAFTAMENETLTKPYQIIAHLSKL